jgi:hypothetical protein
MIRTSAASPDSSIDSATIRASCSSNDPHQLLQPPHLVLQKDRELPDPRRLEPGAVSVWGGRTLPSVEKDIGKRPRQERKRPRSANSSYFPFV